MGAGCQVGKRKNIHTISVYYNQMRVSVPFDRPDDLYLSWLAGFWEGEGSLRFANGSWGLTIAQKEEKVLQEIAGRTDGKVYLERASNSHRVYWYGSRALAVLELIEPFLRSDYRKGQIARFRRDAAEYRITARGRGRPQGSLNKPKSARL